VTLNNIYALAKRAGINFQAEVNWSFEFEDQPYFAGFREMASNGLDKPVLNAFRMFGLLGNERVAAESSGALATNEIISAGVRAKPDVGVIGARKENEVAVLLWNYHDDDLPAPDAPVEVTVTGLPARVAKVLAEHFRIDGSHSNSYAAWKALGSPQSPSESQYRELERAGHLQLLESPFWLSAEGGGATVKFNLPRQGMSLLRLAW
jgi:xylan 1,4-beta-xylosidase